MLNHVRKHFLQVCVHYLKYYFYQLDANLNLLSDADQVTISIFMLKISVAAWTVLSETSKPRRLQIKSKEKSQDITKGSNNRTLDIWKNLENKLNKGTV